MKIFIINLITDIERRKAISSQLDKLGLEYEFFDAIDARTFSKKQVSQYIDPQRARKELGKDLKPGEIGCSLSRHRIFQHIIDKNIEYALVLEDDAQINHRIHKILNIVQNEQVHKREYLSLNYSIFNTKLIKFVRNNIIQDFKSRKNIGQNIRKLLLLPAAICGDWFFEGLGKIRPGIHKIFKPISLTGGYIITKSGAEKILSIHDKVFLPQDTLVIRYYKKIGLRFYFAYPMIVKQNEEFESNIQTKN